MSQNISFRLSTVIKDGAQLAASRNGLMFLLIFILLQGVSLLLIFSAGSVYIPTSPTAAGVEAAPTPGEELPQILASQASFITNIVSGILLVPISIIAIRTFVGNKRDKIPDDYIFYRIGRATISAYVASFLMMFVFFCAFIIPFVPLYFLWGTVSGLPLLGLILFLLVVALILVAISWVSLLFVNHTIAIEDAGPVSALRKSWSLSAGHRLRLFAIAALFAILQSVILSPVSLLPEPLGLFLLLPFSCMISVLSVGIFAQAYLAIHPDTTSIQQRLST